MNDYKLCSSPFKQKSIQVDFSEGLSEGPDRELVFFLFYLALTGRLYILFSVYILSQIRKKPTVTPWIGLKHIQKYLNGSINLKLV